jgi:hypothetical protein
MGEHSVNTPSHRISKLSALRRDTLRKIDQVGLAQTLSHGLKKIVRDLLQPFVAQSDPFDKKYGTDTERIISVGALDIPDVKLKHSLHHAAIRSPTVVASSPALAGTIHASSERAERLQFRIAAHAQVEVFWRKTSESVAGYFTVRPVGGRTTAAVPLNSYAPRSIVPSLPRAMPRASVP